MLEDADVLSGYGAGAVDYLTKPFNPQILRHKVAVFADLFRKTRALAELNEKLEQRVAERTEELQKSETALRAAARQKDEFLATLAHELRNPLAPIRTGLDLLMQIQAPQTQVAGKTLAAMNRQLDHIVRLIDDLLDVSRISRGVLELKKEVTNLATLIQASIDQFKPVFEQRGIKLMVAMPPSITAIVDPTRISQVIGNLMHNASKFTQNGGTVRIDLELIGGDAIVRITDNGVGIPSDQIDRVFEMFARIERTASKGDRGAGIGLALAKRLARMHGGDLTAWSAGENRGTTFTVGIPGAAVVPITLDSAPERLGSIVTGKALDILLIEDNDDVADTLGAWLETLGHRVTIARTGPKGLELALTTKPQLVLCDIGLPEMDGVEVCQRVRQASTDFRPVMVALTGWGKEEDRMRTKDAGFDHHLVKPVALDTLSKLIAGVPTTPEDRSKLS
jgi:signal transduction histidine kinase/ActR/RegA family two-component response regulator